MRVLHIDFETASAADLPTVGVHKYAEHWTTHVYCMAYAFDKETPSVWFMWESFPQEVIEHVAAGGIVVAHNAAFERTLWNVVLRRPNTVRGFPAVAAPELKIEQMVCTMARASTISLPAGLDYVAQVMGFEVRKDAEGAAIMKKFMNPEKVTFFEDGHAEYAWRNDEAGFRRVGEYCKTDVEVEVRADAALMQHTPGERRVWELDQKINDRGVALDIRLITEAAKVVDAAKARLHTRMAEITGGEVKKCSEVKKLVAWINSKGIDCTSVAKGQQEELILQADIVDKTVREAIELRQQSGKGSPTSKYQTMLDCACADGKARGQLFYHGANTGRWAGRLIQFQNLPGMDEDRDGANVRAVVEILLCDNLSVDQKVDALGLITGAVLPSLSRALRWMLIASPGCRFVGGDLSNIEGCVAAWITDEEWKVEAYREFQAGRGADLYKLAYSRGFGAGVASITKIQRQIGKVIELALGYQGSIGAFISMARIYGVKPGDMVEPIRRATKPDVWEATRLRMRRPGTRTYGLTEDEWTAARVAVDTFRATNAKITAAWWELQDAAIAAVAEPGKPVECLNGRVAYVVARNVLWCRLPSGRTLAYHRPRLKVNTAYQMTDADNNTAYVDEAEVPRCLGGGFTFVLDEEGQKTTRQKRQVIFEHYDSLKKRWVEGALYGGLQFENVVQATARDVMIEGMFAAEEKGYPIVLTVHDELLCDVPAGHGSAAELQSIMSTVPSWCQGLPLAAKTWEDVRYAK